MVASHGQGLPTIPFDLLLLLSPLVDEFSSHRHHFHLLAFNRQSNGTTPIVNREMKGEGEGLAR